MRTRTSLLLTMVLGVLSMQFAYAQSPPGIYTCVDAKGRKRTSDRPIAECMDREQKVLNPSGTVRTIIAPPLTEPERAAQEAKQRREAEERARQRETKRRERTLLMRYPDRAAHDKARAEALAQVETGRQTAVGRVKELERQRKQLDTELEFYANDPSRVPASLKRSMEENEQNREKQEHFIAEQDTEVQRVNERFDEELGRLRPLWKRAGVADR